MQPETETWNSKSPEIEESRTNVTELIQQQELLKEADSNRKDYLVSNSMPPYYYIIVLIELNMGSGNITHLTGLNRTLKSDHCVFVDAMAEQTEQTSVTLGLLLLCFFLYISIGGLYTCNVIVVN